MGCHFLASLEKENRDRVKQHYAGLLVVRGCGHFCNHDGRQWRLTPGAFVQHLPNQWHILHRDDPTLWCEASLSLDFKLYQAFVDLGVINPQEPVLTPVNWEELVPRFSDIQKRMQQMAEHELPGLLIDIQRLLWDIRLRHQRRSASDTKAKNLDWAADFLASNLHVCIDYEDVATQCALSYSHFRRLFRQRFGLPPAAFRRRAKLNTAKFFLQDPSLPVSEIARALGYPDIFAFSRQFQRYFRISPSEYRRLFLAGGSGEAVHEEQALRGDSSAE
ncbi:MAG: AraC family transcriptional regulator [Lentisphaerae bacterium]|nr:MAG: AraC family transcriptional regulator [Lentisphaerota bacterium]